MPQPLVENTGLAFMGETPWLPAQLTARQTKSLLAANNPTGRPNADVIRHFIGVVSGQIEEITQIDFPSYFTEREASLYLKPFAQQQQRAAKEPVATWWLNPNANPKLRTAIARLDRYLATPLASVTPTWNWIDSDRLPTASLLAVARDDDFAHGVLQSHFFQAWGQAWSRKISPLEIVETFPLPWAPATRLSALTKAREEHRLAIARAARAGAQEQLDTAVASAYHCASDLSDAEVVTFLHKLNAQRAK